MADARVQVVINAVDNASKQLQSVSDRVNDLARTAGQAGRSMLALGAPVVAAATGAVKLFSDFESSMSRIVGLVGLSTEQVDEWKDVLLEMAPAVGKGPQELADALYFITSAGLRGEEAIEALNAAAKASTAGLGETKVVADALTSAMNAYATSGLSAEQSTSILVATVREGKAEADSIAQSLGRVIPIAAEMGISFDQVGAAIAAMTRLGLDADESSTALRQVMATLLNPTRQAEDALKEVGLSASDLRAQIREEGLLSVLTTLRDAFKGNDDALINFFPNIRALTGVLNLVGQNADQTADIFQSLAGTTGKDLNDAFAAAADTTKFQLDQSMAELKVTLISIGAIIVPLFTQLLQALQPLIKGIRNFTKEHPLLTKVAVILAAALVVLGTALIALSLMLPGLALGITAVSTVMTFLAANPIGLVIIAVAALVAGIVLLVKNWDTVKVKAEAVWGAMVDIVRGAVNKMIGFVNALIRAFNSIKVTIPSWVPGMGGNEFGIDIPEIPQLAHGGIVTRPTMAMIGEAGPEAVIPLTGVMAGMLGMGKGVQEALEGLDKTLGDVGTTVHELGLEFEYVNRSALALEEQLKELRELDRIEALRRTEIERLEREGIFGLGAQIEDFLQSTLNAQILQTVRDLTEGGLGVIAAWDVAMREASSTVMGSMSEWAAEVEHGQAVLDAFNAGTISIGEAYTTLKTAFEGLEKVVEETIEVFEGQLVFQMRSLADSLRAAIGEVGGPIRGLVESFAGREGLTEALADMLAGRAVSTEDLLTIQGLIEEARRWFNIASQQNAGFATVIAARAQEQEFPGIPTMQHGGIVTRPTMAMIGEAGPEAVIPLGNRGGQSQPIIVLQIDGRTIATVLGNQAVLEEQVRSS